MVGRKCEAAKKTDHSKPVTDTQTDCHSDQSPVAKPWGKRPVAMETNQPYRSLMCLRQHYYLYIHTHTVQLMLIASLTGQNSESYRAHDDPCLTWTIVKGCLVAPKCIDEKLKFRHLIHKFCTAVTHKNAVSWKSADFWFPNMICLFFSHFSKHESG